MGADDLRFTRGRADLRSPRLSPGPRGCACDFGLRVYVASAGARWHKWGLRKSEKIPTLAQSASMGHPKNLREGPHRRRRSAGTQKARKATATTAQQRPAALPGQEATGTHKPRKGGATKATADPSPPSKMRPGSLRQAQDKRDDSLNVRAGGGALSSGGRSRETSRSRRRSRASGRVAGPSSGRSRLRRSRPRKRPRPSAAPAARQSRGRG